MTEVLNGTETEVQTFQNYINGQWRDAASGETFESRNPTRASDVIGNFPASSSEDVAAAVEAAKKAFKTWRLMPAPKRGEILKRVGDLASNVESIIDGQRTTRQALGEILASLPVDWRFFVKHKVIEAIERLPESDRTGKGDEVRRAFEIVVAEYSELAEHAATG